MHTLERPLESVMTALHPLFRRHPDMDNKPATVQPTPGHESRLAIRQEDVDAYVNNLSEADFLAIKADLIDAEDELGGTDVTDMPSDEFHLFLTRF